MTIVKSIDSENTGTGTSPLGGKGRTEGSIRGPEATQNVANLAQEAITKSQGSPRSTDTHHSYSTSVGSGLKNLVARIAKFLTSLMQTLRQLFSFSAYKPVLKEEIQTATKTSEKSESQQPAQTPTGKNSKESSSPGANTLLGPGCTSLILGSNEPRKRQTIIQDEQSEIQKLFQDEKEKLESLKTQEYNNRLDFVLQNVKKKKEIGLIEKNLSGLQKKLNDEKTTLSSLETEKEIYLKAVTQNNISLKKVSTKLEQLTKSLEEVDTSLTDVNSELSTLPFDQNPEHREIIERRSTTLRTQSKGLQNSKEHLQKQIKLAKTKQGELLSSIRSQDRAQKETKINITKTSDSIKLLQASIETLEKQLVSLQS